MADREISGRRSGLYSAWHRIENISQYVGDSAAREMQMIDLDHLYRCDRWLEYDGRCGKTLFVVESFESWRGRDGKNATVTQALAVGLGVEGYLVCTLVAAGRIRRFAVKQLAKDGAALNYRAAEWREMEPEEYAAFLLRARKRAQRCTNCPEAKEAS